MDAARAIETLPGARDPADLAGGPHVGHDRLHARLPTRSCSTTPRSPGRTSSTRGTRGSRRSGARPIRRAATRTPPRCAATTCPGSGRRAATPSATGCSSPSCPRSRWTAERQAEVRRRRARVPDPPGQGDPLEHDADRRPGRRTRAGSRGCRAAPPSPASPPP